MKLLSFTVLVILTLLAGSYSALSETRKTLAKQGAWTVYSVSDFYVNHQGGTYGGKKACMMETGHTTGALRMTILADGMLITEATAPSWSFSHRNSDLFLTFDDVQLELDDSEYKGQTIRQVTKTKQGLGFLNAVNKNLAKDSSEQIGVLNNRKRLIAKFPASGFKASLERVIKCQKSL